MFINILEETIFKKHLSIFTETILQDYTKKCHRTYIVHENKPKSSLNSHSWNSLRI